jgi:Do/DeqQ family serine protease
MNTRRFSIRAGLAVLAAAFLITGTAWHTLAVSTPQTVTAASAAKAEAATPGQSVTGRIAGGRDSYADIVKTVAPAVVTIRVDGKATASPTQFEGDDLLRRFFGDRFGDGEERGPRQVRPFKQHGLGSGVIVSPDGYILTNNHVVDGADKIHVDLTDGRTLDAKVIGTDKPSDLALVKVNTSDLHALPLGNSEAVQVGDVVLAVGNPLGIGQTVTMGIISAKGRSTGSGGDRGYEDFLQTDAPINHGNSGGALVNTKGELIGINSQIVSQSDGNIGIGFAIPSNMARHVMDDLRKDGRVRRAQLGVSVQPMTSDLAASLGLKQVGGAIIGSVTADGAADRAGLKRGDVIKSFNGQPVNDVNSLRNRVAEAQPGSTATVVIVRDGSEKTVSVKLDEAEVGKRSARADEPASADSAALGVSAEPLNADLARQFGVPSGTKGVVVKSVNPDGRAADAGLREGDIIQEVNRQPVQTVEELRSAVRKTTDRPLLLFVQRDGSNLFLTVKPAA